MLAGDHHAGDPAGQAEHILHRHLGLAVRPQALDAPIHAGVGQQPGQPVGQDNGQGQEFLRLRTGIAVQDALVPGPGLALLVNGPGDVGTLIVGDDLHLVVQAGIPRLPHRLADDGGDVGQLLGGDLARHQELARRGHDLTGHTRAGVVGQTGIQDGIRDGVAQLVRVALGDRLGGQDVLISHGWSSFGVCFSLFSAPI